MTRITIVSIAITAINLCIIAVSICLYAMTKRDIRQLEERLRRQKEDEDDGK